MPSEGTKILEFNQYQKYDKAPFIIYADLECGIEKIDGCKNNPENSSTRKTSEHIPSGFSMSTISLFRSIVNKHDVYRGIIFVKKFCESLREHAMKTINFNYTGEYRGAAHSKCNLKYGVFKTITFTVPIEKEVLIKRKN